MLSLFDSAPVKAGPVLWSHDVLRDLAKASDLGWGLVGVLAQELMMADIREHA